MPPSAKPPHSPTTCASTRRYSSRLRRSRCSSRRSAKKGLAHYWAKYFAGWQNEPAIGEGREWHLYLLFVAPRIRESLPDARLIAVLRDPVERAFSYWWHQYSHAQERLAFDSTVEKDRELIESGDGFRGQEGAERWRKGLYGVNHSTRHRALLDLGFYSEQLERYLELFAEPRLKIVFYEDLSRDLPSVLREIFAFLQVDPDVQIPDLAARNVQRQTVRSPAARRLLFAIRALGLRHLVPKVLRPRIHRLAERPAQRQEMLPGTRARLIDYFEPYRRRLESLTGRDLSSWRESAPV